LTIARIQVHLLLGQLVNATDFDSGVSNVGIGMLYLEPTSLFYYFSLFLELFLFVYYHILKVKCLLDDVNRREKVWIAHVLGRMLSLVVSQ
jgi:hypothetical protein